MAVPLHVGLIDIRATLLHSLRGSQRKQDRVRSILWYNQIVPDVNLYDINHLEESLEGGVGDRPYSGYTRSHCQ